MVVASVIATFIVIQWLHKRLNDKSYRLGGPTQALYIFSNFLWLFQFLPWVFMVGSFVAELEKPVLPVLGLFAVGGFGLFLGGMAIADLAFEIDKTVNPWKSRPAK